jgi:hypothetical protein
MSIPLFQFKPKATVLSMALTGLIGVALIPNAQALSLGGAVGGLLGGSGPQTAGAPAAKVKSGVAGAGATIANGTVMLAWTGDGVALPVPAQTGRDKDFLAVIDSEPYSSTYGKVIWTAELPSIVGGVPGGVLDTATHNDPHHMLSYTSYTDPSTKRKYTLAGGVISKNVFRFDITSVRNIGKAAPVVCGLQPTQSSLTDDFLVMPNGNIMFTYMSNFGYSGNETGEGTPLGGGTLSEINPMRTAKTIGVTIGGIAAEACLPGPLGGSSEDIHSGKDVYLGEYQVAPDSGPSSYVSRRAPNHEDTQAHRADGSNKGFFFFGNTNAAKEGLPHGMVLSYDAKYLVAADYSVAVSIGAAAANLIMPGLDIMPTKHETFSTFGSAVRVTRVNPLTLDPVPAYSGTPSTNGYFNPTTITYGGSESTMHGLDGAPNGAVANYMHSISVVPDGPRRESIAFHEENEALMPFAMFHQPHHCSDQAGWNPGADGVYGTADDPLGDKACAGQEVRHDGASVDSMCGGTMFYTANVRLPQSANNGAGPIWHAVYDVGPCAGVSYHAVTDDDRFVVQPVSGIMQESAAEFDRDYPRENSRRMLTLDFRPLLAKGNGINADCNGDGKKTEDDLACGASFVDPVQCHFSGSAVRTRKDGHQEVNGALGLPMTAPGDGGPAISPADYVATTGTPAAEALNLLVHNNRADDCPRVVGVVGQMENGSHPQEPGTGIPAGDPTTQTGNNFIYPGVGYTQYVGTILENVHSDTDVGGAPSLTNLNTAQNMNTRGGPHFTFADRIGFCLPTGATNGVANCKAGSYYDLRPDMTAGGAPKHIYPTSASALQACANGTSAYKGSGPGAVDPKCVQRVTFHQYFVELGHVPAPGTGSDGDRTICMMMVNRVTGDSMMDPLWVDELTKQPCLDFDSAARERKTFGLLGADTCGTAGNNIAGDYCWPGARGGKGGAKPHAASFERDGANLMGPGYFPPASADLDGVK